MMHSKEFKYIFLFALVLLLIGVGLHFTGKTVLDVDQIYCRGFYPWKAVHPELNCSQERDGDHIFESTFIATELDYLSQNPYQHSYSERIMNGYPVSAGYTGNQYTLTRLLNKIMPVTSSTNFVALFYLFVSFVIGYAIARTLSFEHWYAAVFGFLSITTSYVFLIEAYNMSLIGFGLVALGALQFYIKNRKLLFIALTLCGALCIILSAFFQLYIYAALCVLLLGSMYFFVENKKKIFMLFLSVGILFSAAALLTNTSLLQHASFLKVSTKIDSQVTLKEFIKHKDYSFDPMGWIGYEPVQLNRKIVAIFFGDKFGYYTYGAVTAGNWSPGPVFVVLYFIGMVFLWKRYRWYVLFSLFWLLYSAGYIQLLLSVIIGSPFKEETSLRASNLFFLFGTFAVIYALQGLVQHTIVLSKNWNRIIKIFFIYLSAALPVFIIVRYRGHHEILLESIYITISSMLFLVWMYFWKSDLASRKKYFLISILVVSLILPSFSRLFLGVNPVVFSVQNSNLYYPKTEFEKSLENFQSTDQKINRVALIQTTESGRIQHQNGPAILGLNTITGYRNPIYRNYADLFYYNKFVFEGSNNPKQDLENLQKSVSYLNNDLGSLKATSSKITLGKEIEKYFTLTGVNGIIGPNNLEIKNNNWQKAFIADNLSLWYNKNPIHEFFFTQQEASKIKLIKKADGYRLFKSTNISSSGTLTVPVTFDKHWKVKFIEKTGTTFLRTFVSNGAFLGVTLPPGSGTIEVLYDDSSHTVNYILSGIGIFIILLAIFLLRLSSLPEQE